MWGGDGGGTDCNIYNVVENKKQQLTRPALRPSDRESQLVPSDSEQRIPVACARTLRHEDSRSYLTRAGLVLGAARARPFTPPLINRPLGHLTTRGKRHSKERQNHDETSSVISKVGSEVRSPEIPKAQILPLSNFFPSYARISTLKFNLFDHDLTSPEST